MGTVTQLPRTELTFQGFGKIPRLFRPVVVTEKIDGSNAAVRIEPLGDAPMIPGVVYSNVDGERWLVYAQSRKRIITPADDNFGFAAWVEKNSLALVRTLGEGLHFGEWWGKGIQRGYGMDGRVFSLFNVSKWADEESWEPKPELAQVDGLTTVPILAKGIGMDYATEAALDILREEGSYAAPGFMNPEGVIAYHRAGNLLFKATLENDEVPKALALENSSLAA